MRDTTLLPDLITLSAERSPEALALTYAKAAIHYSELHNAVARFAGGLMGLGLQRGERVAIYLEKRFETVIVSFGAPAAGGVFVPLNPLLKPEQVAYILRDCNVRVLITSPARHALLRDAISQCHDLRHVVILDSQDPLPTDGPIAYSHWSDLLSMPTKCGHRVIDTDMAGNPLHLGQHRQSQRRGALPSQHGRGRQERRQYLENTRRTHPLAALPLCFDAGFSQLTTAFPVGARVVLLNYLLPRDVLRALRASSVTGLTAVPPLCIQLAAARMARGDRATSALFRQYRRPHAARHADRLRAHLPKAKPFLMYGLTEAFRSTYLAAHRSRPPARIRSARPFPMPKSWSLREDGHHARPMNRANWCIAARWSAWATGTTPTRPPNATSRYRPCAGTRAGLVCPRSPCSPAIPCAWTTRGSSISSAGATR